MSVRDGASDIANAVPQSGNVDGLVSRVILLPEDRQVLTFKRLTDARTALARGLAEYLGAGKIPWIGGATYGFANVLWCWAEPEENAKFPSLVVMGNNDGTYDGGMSPETVKCGDGSGRYLRSSDELQQEFWVQVWTTNPVARSALCSMIEDMLEPNDSSKGVRLELPYYFGARASYSKLAVSYLDTAEDAQKRWRLAAFRVQGSLTQYIPVGDLPYLKIATELTVE